MLSSVNDTGGKLHNIQKPLFSCDFQSSRVEGTHSCYSGSLADRPSFLLSGFGRALGASPLELLATHILPGVELLGTVWLPLGELLR